MFRQDGSHMETDRPTLNQEPHTTEDTTVVDNRRNNFTKERLKDFAKDTLSNTNAALASVLASVPELFALLLALNYYAPKEDKLTATRALCSLFFGYFMTILVNANLNVFKGFTMTQAFVLTVQISKFGLKALPLTTALAGLFILLFSLVKIYKILDTVPTCVRFGMQLATGLGLLIREIFHMLGLPTSPQGKYDLFSIFDEVQNEKKEASLPVFGVCALCSILLALGMWFRPRVPWHLFSFGLFFLGGYYYSDTQKGVTTFGEDWGADAHFHKEFAKFAHSPKHSVFSMWGSITDPAFLINCGALAFVTLVEMSATLKLAEFTLKKPADNKAEYIGVGVSNLIAGILGILPLSLPIGRGLLGIKAGANNYLYPIMSCVFTFLLGYFFYSSMRYLPVILVSIFNVSLALLLLNISHLINYFKMSPKYALVSVSIVILSLFTNIVAAMVLGWFIFGLLYMQVPNIDLFARGDIDEIIREAKIFECKRGEEGSQPYPEDSDCYEMEEDEGEESGLIGKPLKQTSLLTRISQGGTVYELRGRFNFLHYRTHLANIRHLERDIVLVDLQKVFKNDSEFVIQYSSFFKALSREPIEFYVTGIPFQRATQDCMLEGTWLEQLKADKQLIYIS